MESQINLGAFKVHMGEFKYHNDSIPQTLKSKEYWYKKQQEIGKDSQKFLVKVRYRSEFSVNKVIVCQKYSKMWLMEL